MQVNAVIFSSLPVVLPAARGFPETEGRRTETKAHQASLPSHEHLVQDPAHRTHGRGQESTRALHSSSFS